MNSYRQKKITIFALYKNYRSMIFTKEDVEQIKAQGLTVKEAEEQVENFVNGFQPMQLKKAATIGDGINSFSTQEIKDFISLYQSEKDKIKVMKFVPASGAATRMMKDLYSFVDEYKDEKRTPFHTFPVVQKLIEHIKEFAFYPVLEQIMKKDNLSVEQCLKVKDYKTIVEYILTEKGLNYGKYPKAWIIFHKNNDSAVTPFEEHLMEAANYCSSNGEAKIEFSILKEHADGFRKLKNKFVPLYEKQYKVKYDIGFSFQQHSTDTIAVDMNNKPFHTKEGKLLFRPAGHGALIANLNKLNSDVIFIKNIDNVSSKYRQETYDYKEFLAGVLLTAEKKIFSLQKKLEKKEMSKQELVSICNIIRKQAFISEVKNYTEFNTLFQYKLYLRKFLDRPLRVCGMVKNEGEPGGGPFFVEKNGEISLQIVEKAQVNLSSLEQSKIFMQATHFNPVDLVISTTKADGKKYRLQNFVDKQAGFISEKSFAGQTIKAQERPGLWNGAMSDWLTIFVEVPLATFNPVKTIVDLLKESHK